MKIRIGLFLLLSLFLVTSCKNLSKTVSKKEKLKLTPEVLLGQIKAAEFKEDPLSFKLSTKVEADEKSFPLKANVRMLRDSILWMSIGVTSGLEMARIMITNDSVWFLNRLTKEYMAESIELLQEKFGVGGDLKSLQAILLGNPALNTKIKWYNTPDLENYSIRSSSETDIDRSPPGEPFVTMTAEKTTFKLLAMLIKDVDSGMILSAKYSAFESVGSGSVPTKVLLQLKGPETRDFELDYSKFEVGEELDYPFRIPDRYEKMD